MICPTSAKPVKIYIEDVETSEICDARLSIDLAKLPNGPIHRYVRTVKDHRIRILLKIEDVALWSATECLIVTVHLNDAAMTGDYKIYVPHPQTNFSHCQVDAVLETQHGYEIRIGHFQAHLGSWYQDCVMKLAAAKQYQPDHNRRRKSIQSSYQCGSVGVWVEKAVLRETRRPPGMSVCDLSAKACDGFPEETLFVALEPEGERFLAPKSLDFTCSTPKSVGKIIFHCRETGVFQSLVDEYEAGCWELVEVGDGWQEKVRTSNITPVNQQSQDPRSAALQPDDQHLNPSRDTGTLPSPRIDEADNTVEVVPLLPHAETSTATDDEHTFDMRSGLGRAGENEEYSQRIVDFIEVLDEIRELEEKLQDKKTEARLMEQANKRKRDWRSSELEEIEARVSRRKDRKGSEMSGLEEHRN